MKDEHLFQLKGKLYKIINKYIKSTLHYEMPLYWMVKMLERVILHIASRMPAYLCMNYVRLFDVLGSEGFNKIQEKTAKLVILIKK